LALAWVRDPRDHRVSANEEDLADFETDVGAPVQICRIAHAVSPSHWRVQLRAGRALPSRGRPGAASASTSASDRRWLPAEQWHRAGM